MSLVGFEIAGEVDFLGEAGEIALAVVGDGARLGGVGRDAVGAVGLLAVERGDVPAAPAIGEGGAVVGDDGAVARGRAGGIGEDRADEDAGDAQRRRALVAVQADGLAGEARGFGRRLVEDGAEARIGRGDFEVAGCRAPSRRRHRR